ncbi:MAG TPA: hypothetical protein VMG32_13380 [Anaeromyxobacteraceae bacterium]|nr:hypothetical protein [Anaeromyxobacteraceae bacterium]
MAESVLDRLREVVLDNRERREERPAARGRQVFVDPGGRIVLGDAVPEGEGHALSEVHQAVFAASGAIPPEGA